MSEQEEYSETRPEVVEVIWESGEVSDEIDYAVNRFVVAERGMGLTACQPSLVRLADGTEAIRFKLDFTFVDAETDEIMGYGKLGTEEGFVGEVFISYDPKGEDIHMLYITPSEEIEKEKAKILANPEKFPPSKRPKGKY